MRYVTGALCALLLMSSLAFAQDGEGSATAEENWNPEPGQVVHLEIPSLDLQESAKFYGDLFGWTTLPAGPNEGYLLWSDGGQTMGGFTLDAKPAEEGGPVIYIFVRSIAEAFAAITAAGGEAVGTEISVGEGYIGMFRDPHGNLMGLFATDASMPATDAAPEA